MVYLLEVECEADLSEAIPFILHDFNFTGAEYSAGLAQLYFHSQKERKDAREYLKNNFGSIIISTSEKSIEERNWNAIWESNFNPIDIPPDIHIRAEFHPVSTAQIELIIQPEMAFGTGHHATTFLMGAEMRNLDLNNRTVLDFGCGTGILSILASKLGAESVLAIDIEDEAVKSARKNCLINATENIEVKKGSIDIVDQGLFDIILANINRNVLMASIEDIYNLSNSDSIILLSGILKDDLEVIRSAFGRYWNTCHVKQKGGWLCVKFQNLISSS